VRWLSRGCSCKHRRRSPRARYRSLIETPFRHRASYVNGARLLDVDATHPTWTHGQLMQRILSGIARAELVRHGYAVFGRAPLEVLPAMSEDDLREAAPAELTGYWSWVARHSRLWLDPVMTDLGLTSMARGRHAGDRRAADQEPCHRAGLRTRLADRPDAGEASRAGCDLSSTTDRARFAVADSSRSLQPAPAAFHAGLPHPVRSPHRMPHTASIAA
jgi:hypothetical protein